MPLKLTALDHGKIKIEADGVIARHVLEYAKLTPESAVSQLIGSFGWDGTIPEPVRVEKWPGPWFAVRALSASPIGHTIFRISDRYGNIVADCYTQDKAEAILSFQSQLHAAEKVVELSRQVNARQTLPTLNAALAAYDAEVGGK